LLIVAAFPPELAPFGGRLVGDARPSFGRHTVAAEAVGIGLAAAAVGTAKQLAARRPRAVVLVGTCGAFGDAIALGGVAVSRRVVLAEPAVAEGRAGYPEPMQVELSAAEGLAMSLGERAASAAPRGRLADVATTLAVTTDDLLAARLQSFTSCDVEHLEAFGVASACAAGGVPFVAALGVANRVGASGRAEWRANHRTASEAAVGVVLGWLDAGAPGLAAG